MKLFLDIVNDLLYKEIDNETFKKKSIELRNISNSLSLYFTGINNIKKYSTEVLEDRKSNVNKKEHFIAFIDEITTYLVSTNYHGLKNRYNKQREKIEELEMLLEDPTFPTDVEYIDVDGTQMLVVNDVGVDENISEKNRKISVSIDYYKLRATNIGKEMYEYQQKVKLLKKYLSIYLEIEWRKAKRGK